MAAGETATRAVSEQLQALALPEAQYAAYEAQRLAAPPPQDQPQPLMSLTIRQDRRINPAALAAQSGLVLGAPVTLEQIRLAGASLFGRGDLSRVETEVSEVPGGRSVLIKPTEADWARNRLRVGLELASDFSDNNSFALKLMHVRTSLNDWDGELRSVAQVGTRRKFGVQLWQPLGAGSPWYAAASTEYGAAADDVFSAERRKLRYGYNYGSATLALGRQFGNWGNLQVSTARQRVNGRITIPDNDADPVRALQTVRNLSFNIDTLDSVAFPTRGAMFDLEVDRIGNGVGQPVLLNQQGVRMLQAFHKGRWAGHVYGEWARSQEGLAPLSLGGFLRLSGTEPASVEGRSVLLGRVVMAHAIGAMPAPLGGVARLGFSLEAGGGYGAGQSLGWSTLKQAGSVFVAADTRFGPLYFGAGATKGSGGTLYLFLGPIW